MQRFSRWANRLSFAGEMVGVLGIWVMTLVTCVDVIGAKVFNMPVPGSTEVISLAQVITIVFAVATTYLHKGHISVEMFITRRRPAVKSAIRSFVTFLGLVLFLLLIYEGVRLGNEYAASQEVTATIQLPFYPFAYGFAMALVPIAMLLAVEFFQSMKEMKN